MSRASGESLKSASTLTPLRRVLPDSVLAMMKAFPGSTPRLDATMWAGIAIKAIDAGRGTPELDEYVAGLPGLTADAVRSLHRTGWEWAPCTECGAPAGVPAPPKPSKPREIGNADGPRCRITPGCSGRCYPLDGPLPHPLGEPEPPLPW